MKCDSVLLLLPPGIPMKIADAPFRGSGGCIPQRIPLSPSQGHHHADEKAPSCRSKTPQCRSQRPRRFSLSPGAARPADTSPLPTPQPPIYYGYMERSRGLGQDTAIGPESRDYQWSGPGALDKFPLLAPKAAAINRPCSDNLLPWRCPARFRAHPDPVAQNGKNGPQSGSPRPRPPPVNATKCIRMRQIFFSRPERFSIAIP